MNSKRNCHVGEKSAFLTQEAHRKVKDVCSQYCISLCSLLSAVVDTADLAAVAETLASTFKLPDPEEVYYVKVNGVLTERRDIDGKVLIWAPSPLGFLGWRTWEDLPYELRAQLKEEPKPIHKVWA